MAASRQSVILLCGVVDVGTKYLQIQKFCGPQVPVKPAPQRSHGHLKVSATFSRSGRLASNTSAAHFVMSVGSQSFLCDITRRVSLPLNQLCHISEMPRSICQVADIREDFTAVSPCRAVNQYRVFTHCGRSRVGSCRDSARSDKVIAQTPAAVSSVQHNGSVAKVEVRNW